MEADGSFAKQKGRLQKRIIKDKSFDPIFMKKNEAVPLQAPKELGQGNGRHPYDQSGLLFA